MADTINLGADNILGRVRINFSYNRYQSSMDFVTNSFPGLPGPITFFYQTNIEIENTMMLSAYVDVFQSNKIDVYLGAGVGESRVSLTTSDGIVGGENNDKDRISHMELGLDYKVTDAIIINFGVRKTDLGSVNIVMTPSGGKHSFELEPSKEVFLGARYAF